MGTQLLNVNTVTLQYFWLWADKCKCETLIYLGIFLGFIQQVHHPQNSIFWLQLSNLCHTYSFFSQAVLPTVSFAKVDKVWHDREEDFFVDMAA